MKCLKKKKISFLLFFIFHKRSGEKLLFFSANSSNVIMPLVILCTYLYIEYWYYKEKFDLKGQGLQVFFRAPITQPCTLSLSFIFCIYLICTWAGQCALKIGPLHVKWYLTCKHQTKHLCNDENKKNNFCQWQNMCKKCSRNCTMNFEGIMAQ